MSAAEALRASAPTLRRYAERHSGSPLCSRGSLDIACGRNHQDVVCNRRKLGQFTRAISAHFQNVLLLLSFRKNPQNPLLAVTAATQTAA